MNANLEAIKPEPKFGDESFVVPEGALGFSVKEFWSWAFSDLLHNVTRGCLVEFIVARALGATNNRHYGLLYLWLISDKKAA